jgi:EAL domain-containing protein (putative c-di-GMP-specific phosphodiesterase class I)
MAPKPQGIHPQHDTAVAARDAARGRARSRQGTDHSHLNAHVRWAGRIGQALTEERFVLHAQAIMPLTGDDPRARYELLVRMVDPTEGVILPGRFLPVAERFDLIQEIDRWVISRAARLLAEQQALGNDVLLEINLSPRTLVAPGLADYIIDELDAVGADATGLCLEYTESEAIVNIDQTHQLASRLQGLGYSFAIDDFGAGFASLYYVKYLDFDYLKIDGEFIADLPESEADQLVVEAVVKIARGMGKRTIAEYVSSEATVDLLRELGVDFAQGFHLARPKALHRTALRQASST